MRILVVDDSKVARAVLKKILAELGYDEVAEASDGQAALERIAHDAYDLIITDWNMPNLDGLGLVQALQEAGNLSPILMVSSESYLSRIVDVMHAGAHGYIRKPFTADALRAKITEVLKKRELSEQSAASAALSGRLDEIGFPELVQFLTSCRMTGRLEIQAGDASGFVDVCEGEVQAAECGNLTGDDALFAIAEFDGGAFRFQPSGDLVDRNVTMPTLPLLIEAMKRRDEKAEQTTA